MTDYEPTRQMGSLPNKQSSSESNYSNSDQQGYTNPQQGYPIAKTQVLRRYEGPMTMAWVVIVNGYSEGQIFRMDPDATVIGRDPGCHFVLDDESASRQHIKIRQVEGKDKKKKYILHDMASENGTYLNGKEVVKAELSDNDYITVGKTEMVFKQILPKTESE